jgi:hypothetical protein
MYPIDIKRIKAISGATLSMMFEEARIRCWK